MKNGSQEQEVEEGDQNNHNPRPFKKFRRGDYQADNERRQRPQAINEHTAQPPPLRVAQSPPVKHHTSLRERKRHEHAYSIEVNESCRNTIEHNQQEDGKQG